MNLVLFVIYWNYRKFTICCRKFFQRQMEWELSNSNYLQTERVSMSKKKDMKKLIERIEAIETEIKSFKETAEKNVATLSAEIERLTSTAKSDKESPKPKRTRKTSPKNTVKKDHEVSGEEKASAKATVRKTRTRKSQKEKVDASETSATKNETADTQEANPAEEKTSVEKPKATRTRKPRTAVKSDGEKKERKPREWKGASFVLYNCDEAKTPESMFNRNDETFKDNGVGRRALWNKLKTEIEEGRIELLNNTPIKNVQLDVTGDKPESANKYLKYGLIERVAGKS